MLLRCKMRLWPQIYGLYLYYVLFSSNVHLLGFKMIFLMYKGSSPHVFVDWYRFFFSFSPAFILTMMNILSTDHSIKEKTNSKKKRRYYLETLISSRLLSCRLQCKCGLSTFTVYWNLEGVKGRDGSEKKIWALSDYIW